jgi:hypothetical protein
MGRRCGLLVLVIVMLAAVGLAQDTERKASADAAAKAEKTAWSFYRLDLTVREMDGAKLVNSRSYTLSGRSDEWTRIRIGSKIPVNTSQTGVQYLDVGLNVDARLFEFDSGPALGWTIDFSSLAPESVANGQPVVRSIRSQGYSQLAIGKPVLLSSSDDLNSTHKFVFEVTATKVK